MIANINDIVVFKTGSTESTGKIIEEWVVIKSLNTNRKNKKTYKIDTFEINQISIIDEEDILEIYSRKYKKREFEKEIDIEKELAIDIPKILEKWNSLGLNKLVSIKGIRLMNTKARIKEVGFKKFLESIDKIKESSFLRGISQEEWTITFDWFIKPNNFIKVLEGNYKDKDKELKVDIVE